MNKQFIKPVFIFFLLAMVLLGFFSFQFKNDKLFSLAKNIDIFASLLRELDSYYVDEIDPEKLVAIGINAMLEELDPYTEFIPEEESADFRMQISGEYAGIGALIGNRGEGNMVLMPYTGFPAQNGGLRIADYILFVDTVNVTGKPTAKVSELLKGPANTPVTLRVKRGSDTLEFNLIRKKIMLKNVPYFGKLDEKTGYIKLGDFTSNASTEVRNALLSLKSQGATKLILDLRDNPGGLLNEAVEIVNLFIPKGKEVVKTIGKLQNVNFNYKTTKTPVDKDIPLVVLINERSASAAEIVAGALQDYDRAVLIGRKSFGKGLVQTTIPLSFNSQIKVTTAKYYIPSGRCIQAIDYSQNKDNGGFTAIPDSLRKSFKTMNGRVVLDGAGIEPDEKIENITYAPISFSLVRRNHTFDFATNYYYRHSEITGPGNFSITEKDYQEFVAWLEGKEYDYTTYIEKSVEDLKKFAEKEVYYEEIKSQLAIIENRVNHKKEQDLQTHKIEIKRILSEEIVSRYYFQEGMIQAGLDQDPAIVSALNYLNQPSKMVLTLTANNK